MLKIFGFELWFIFLVFILLGFLEYERLVYSEICVFSKLLKLVLVLDVGRYVCLDLFFVFYLRLWELVWNIV